MIDISLQQDQFEVVPALVQPTLVEVLKSRVKAEMALDVSLPQMEDAEADNAFYIADLGEVYRQHLRWKSLLPRIEPFFGKFFLSFCAN
ncbi:hypothetical protein BGZ95_011828 [Linnemannia exigua]|uniref:Uncharacterized protein n=1 Tax=Linnemannia exigua TaxID=604196 RepID=A0AAD4D9D1_9FUNG|nr:hypothetical protein BGZ95_011828 [Linnemannia exigua]